jgi:hypothetical protein
MNNKVIIGIKVIEKMRTFLISGWERSKKKRKMMAKRYLEGPSRLLQLNCVLPELVKRILTAGREKAIRMNCREVCFLKNSWRKAKGVNHF